MKKIALALLLAFAAYCPTTARADIFGGDVAELAAILIQLKLEYDRIKDQLESARQQVRYTEQTLKQLDPRSFSDVIALYNQGRYTYDSIVVDTQSIGYGIESINQNFQRLFPREKNLKNGRYSDYDRMYGTWQNELQGSAQAAMRAQANAAQLEQNARAAQSILAASRSADGEVRQMQTIVQMLAVIQSQLTTLTQTISAAERVNSNMAAASATEKMMIRDASRRRRENYTSRGKPVPVMKRLP